MNRNGWLTFIGIYTHPNFDSPDEEQQTVYSYEYKNGGLSEKARKVKGDPIRTRAFTNSPTAVNILADFEFNDIGTSLEQIQNISIGRKGSSDAILLLNEERKVFADESNIALNLSNAIPNQFIKRIRIINNQMPTDSKSESEVLEFDIKEGLTDLGTARIEIVTEAEDINFDAIVDIKNSLKQTAESIRFQALSTLNAISRFFGFEHVVGGDGCPMPLFNFTAALNNTMPKEFIANMCYTYTGFDKVDAYNLDYPVNSTVGEVEFDMQVYDCLKLNDENEIQAMVNFNCIRAEDVSAETHLNVFYRGPENMYYNVLRTPLNF